MSDERPVCCHRCVRADGKAVSAGGAARSARAAMSEAQPARCHTCSLSS